MAVYRGQVQGKPTPLGTALTDYRLVISSGSTKSPLRYDVSQLLSSVTLSDSFEQPAQQLELTLSMQQDLETENGNYSMKLGDIVDLGRPVRLYAPRLTPDGRVFELPPGFPQAISPQTGEFYPLNNLIFYGFVFSKSLSASSSGGTMTVTCMDPLYYLARNMYDTPWVASKKTRVAGRNARPRGWRADEIIRQICQDSGLRVSAPPRGGGLENTAVYLRRVVTVGLSLYDVCVLALEKTYNQGRAKRRYTLRYNPRAGVELLARKTPTNADPRDTQVWDLRDDDNLLSATYTASIENLVTAVTVKTDGSKGRKQIGGTMRRADLEARYGAMHQVIDVQSPGTAAEARKAQQALLRDQGRVAETIDVSVPCINSLRAGDGVWVRDTQTGRNNLFWISSLSHSISSSQATTDLTLVREPREIDYPQVGDPGQQPNRQTYVLAKDASGHTIKVAVSYRVVDIVSEGGFGGRGTVFQGDESVATVRKGLKLRELCQGAQPQFLIGPDGKGKASANAVIVGTHTDDVDVKISLSVAQAAGLGAVGKTGRAIAKPKRPKIKGK